MINISDYRNVRNAVFFIPVDMYVETFVLQPVKLVAHFERKFRVNLMYINLTFGKFAFTLCNINFLRVVNVHR